MASAPRLIIKTGQQTLTNPGQSWAINLATFLGTKNAQEDWTKTAGKL
jgi:hypothetical protein